MNTDIYRVNGTTLSNGRLMAPTEVEAAVQRREVVPGHAGWYLCGDVNKSMFDAIRKHNDSVGIRLSAFLGPAGGAYAAITHQLRGMQHRFLLPLFEPSVIAYLNALERQPIQTMLGREGETAAIVLYNELPWRNIVPLVGMCQQNRQIPLEETLAEMTAAIREACHPERIPSVYQGVALTEVSVSVIMPMTYCLAAPQGEESMAVHQI